FSGQGRRRRQPELSQLLNGLIVLQEGAAMKSKALALFLSLVFLLSCATSDSAKQVKIYQDNLALLVGKDVEEVTKTIAYSWKFGLLNRWEAVDPGLETVTKNNFRKHGFSKQEALEIFAPKGAYIVMFFQKLLGQAEASTEVQVDMGLVGVHQQSISQELAYIRVVFKDNKLVHQRVW
ncbi:MAG: hypothetical protein MUP52_05610, partial [Candidatus Aminicenantes bacterium]|nr:hypothetical protein [Candidatus Aminicenantes bacterium]